MIGLQSLLPASDFMVRQPSFFSYSQLSKYQSCPRQWALYRSAFTPKFPKLLSKASLRGTVIHEVLSYLIKLLASKSNPPRGSAEFNEVKSELKNLDTIIAKIWSQETAGAVFLFDDNKFDFGELEQECWKSFFKWLRRDYVHFQQGHSKTNAVKSSSLNSHQTQQSQTTQIDYAQLLKAKGLLSEINVKHPDLPLQGTIDIVEAHEQGAVICDLKTGSLQASHLEQLKLYALLWWRATGELPYQIKISYIGSKGLDKRVNNLVSEAMLLEKEAELKILIAKVQNTTFQSATAHLGTACKYCPVRYLCDDYFACEDEDIKMEADLEIKLSLSNVKDKNLEVLLDDTKIYLSYDSKITASPKDAWALSETPSTYRFLNTFKTSDNEYRLTPRTLVSKQ
jgi:hypothetical protein